MMSDSDSDNTIDLTPIKDLIIQSGVATSEGTDHNIMAVFLAAGVEKIEDLKYLEEKDLETVLPLVKRKKMISHIQMVLEGTSVPLMEHDDSINTSRSSSSSLIEESDEDVMKNKDAAIAAYTFPYQQIPVKMKKWLGTKRPTPAEKAHFVRIVTDNIMAYNCRPSRDNLRPIAKKLVTMFPSSLQTVGVCGAPSLADDTAHYSLLRQMEQRVINQRRSIDSLSKESQGKRKHDHGCKQFNPTSDKTSEELEEIRLDMVTMYQEQQPLDNDEVFHKMSDVFSYLRGVINSGKNGISDLKRDWPLLFTFCGLSSHYDMLVDGSTIETFKGNYLGRMAELACYMQSLQSKNAGIQKVCMQVAEAKQATRSNQPEVFGLLLMIIKYFKEDESCMFRKDENDAIPATPCILTGGQPLLVSTAYKICLDRKVIFQQIGTPEDALAIFFSTFYVFNVEYPEGLAVSMHFLESQIAGINYRSGTKKTKGRYKAKIDGIPVRILALLDGFALFKNSI